MLVENMQVAMQVHHLVIKCIFWKYYYGIDILADICVKKVICPPRLDNERHMIISELNNIILLAKCEMYTIWWFY